MGSFLIVECDPFVGVQLHVFYTCIDFFSEGDSIEFFLHGSMEAFADTVCLWAFRLGFSVVNVFDTQIELKFMVFPVATVFRASVGHDT